MSIPVVALPQQGPIATRPRNQSVYDTEAYNDGVAPPATLSMFVNTTSFTTANISVTKQAGQDTNLETARALGKGDVLDWYAITMPISARGSNLTTAANAVVWEEITRLRSILYFTFYFGKTPYIVCQADEIPAGVGAMWVQTTHPTMTVFESGNTKNDREAYYDVTISGLPQRITDLETFSATLDMTTSAPFTFNPTVELFATVYLKGVLLRGIRG